MLRKLTILFTGLVLCLALAHPAPAETDKSAQQTLRGLKGVMVVITGISQEAEKDGLQKSQLQDDVEDRLRRAGVKVFPRSEGPRVPGQPHLYVRFIDQKRSDMELYAISIAVHLVQMVRLARDGKVITPAETWGMTGVVSVGAKELSSVRKVVGDYVDLFISALLTANPSEVAPSSQSEGQTAPAEAEPPAATQAEGNPGQAPPAPVK